MLRKLWIFIKMMEIEKCKPTSHAVNKKSLCLSKGWLV